MQLKNICLPVKIYNSMDELSQIDQDLIKKSMQAMQHSYSPYSNFKVGAAAILNNENIIIGSNQENASYGVTICAERVLLANHSSLDTPTLINTIAISYKSKNGSDNQPITPCGICRQALSEQEFKQKDAIRILLVGKNEIWELENANGLLPLAFDSSFMPA
ncbi:MAG: cytidine deaminase [Proteobacteria bacterium]|jgi:cytidine deaminase|nr:cytidine deaminase [Pseudomonadota bacterium]